MRVIEIGESATESSTGEHGVNEDMGTHHGMARQRMQRAGDAMERYRGSRPRRRVRSPRPPHPGDHPWWPREGQRVICVKLNAAVVVRVQASQRRHPWKPPKTIKIGGESVTIESHGGTVHGVHAIQHRRRQERGWWSFLPSAGATLSSCAKTVSSLGHSVLNRPS